MDREGENKMDHTSGDQDEFIGYPKPVEAPSTPYKHRTNSNPVLRGLPLAIGAEIVSRVSFLQSYLWKNAGFDTLRDLPYLAEHIPRYDPTVVLVKSANTPGKGVYDDPATHRSLAPSTTGRFHSIADYHALYLSGELTPLAVAKSLLPLLRRDIPNPSPHSVAMICIREEQVLEAAKASTARYAAGKPLGILDGIPIPIKDGSDLAGLPTLNGRLHHPSLPAASSTNHPSQLLAQAGAILCGKSNMHELGADTTGNNPNYGTPPNPYSSSHYPGGSSSGAAHLTSSGLMPLAFGSDGGGSIRIPSSFCGVYGLKTSHNRLLDSGSSVTVVGPMAGSLSDLEVMYRVMASVPDPSHPLASRFAPPAPPSSPFPPSSENFKGPKYLGICKNWFDRADPAVRGKCYAAVDYYVEHLGCEVVDIGIPCLVEGQMAHAFTILCEMAQEQREHAVKIGASSWLDGLNPANKVLLSVASATPAQDFLLAQKLRNLLMAHLAWLFGEYREKGGLVIVTPTTPLAGWEKKKGEEQRGMSDADVSVRNMEFVWLANFTGCPALSCPVGYVGAGVDAKVEDEDGKARDGTLPVGLMGMMEWAREDELLEWGRGCEEWLNAEVERRRPAGWVDVVGLARGEMGEREGK